MILQSVRMIIVGNVSEPYHMGYVFLKSSQDIGLIVETCDTSNYAPSMKYIWGKGLFKLSGKRPLEWWSFNSHLANTIQEFQPQLVFVTGIFPLEDSLFRLCSKKLIKIVNYLTDYPWNTFHYSSKFIDNLKHYDLVFSTKSKILTKLIQHGVKQAKFLPFAYDPFLHYEPQNIHSNIKEKFDSDICFVGRADSERIPYLDAIAELNNNLILKLYGGAWENINVKNWEKHPVVVNEEYRLALSCSKLALGIVRKHNQDESTLRTFEIAACGGCGIYEDTSEHRQILDGYPEYGFFSSPEDLASKCKWLLENPIEREQMRQLGIQLVVKESNTYTARLKTILQWWSQE
ncbi:CgeB family protein [Nostoc sp.]|uniref:CgeB family protein n=1 Tax=Nostoc sp. TaxID=1180 RepID=UPI002FFD25A1